MEDLETSDLTSPRIPLQIGTYHGGLKNFASDLTQFGTSHGGLFF